MSKYFKQIIFPPLPKPPHTETRYDINNRPLKTIQPLTPVTAGDHFDFWFVEVTDRTKNTVRIQLMAACPLCDTSFTIRQSVPNEAIIRHALKENGGFYMAYVKSHCPYCHPNNPVTDHDFKVGGEQSP